MIKYYYYLKYHIALFKLLSDTTDYGVGDEAHNPFTGKRMSWIDYEDLRREARIEAIIKMSNGKLRRVNLTEDLK